VVSRLRSAVRADHSGNLSRPIVEDFSSSRIAGGARHPLRHRNECRPIQRSAATFSQASVIRRPSVMVPWSSVDGILPRFSGRGILTSDRASTTYSDGAGDSAFSTVDSTGLPKLSAALNNQHRAANMARCASRRSVGRLEDGADSRGARGGDRKGRVAAANVRGIRPPIDCRDEQAPHERWQPVFESRPEPPLTHIQHGAPIGTRRFCSVYGN